VNDQPERNTEPPPGRDGGGGGSMLRGCGIAVGIALLILAFIVGQCFI
jgi:hypothetical protein